MDLVKTASLILEELPPGFTLRDPGSKKEKVAGGEAVNGEGVLPETKPARDGSKAGAKKGKRSEAAMPGKRKQNTQAVRYCL